MITIHIDQPDFEKAEDQKELLIKALLYAFGDIEVVYDVMTLDRVVISAKDLHAHKLYSHSLMRERKKMDDKQIYDKVRFFIDQCDFPMLTVIRRMYPYMLIFHGYKLYTQLEPEDPCIAIIDKKLFDDSFEDPEEFNTVWDSILEHGLYKDNDQEIAQSIHFWLTYEGSKFQPLMHKVHERFLKVNEIDLLKLENGFVYEEGKSSKDSKSKIKRVRKRKTKKDKP